MLHVQAVEIPSRNLILSACEKIRQPVIFRGGSGTEQVWQREDRCRLITHLSRRIPGEFLLGDIALHTLQTCK